MIEVTKDIRELVACKAEYLEKCADFILAAYLYYKLDSDLKGDEFQPYAEDRLWELYQHIGAKITDYYIADTGDLQLDPKPKKET